MLLSAGILKPGAGAMTIEYLVSAIHICCLVEHLAKIIVEHHKNYTLKLF